MADRARLVAFDVLRAVDERDAYANLELSRLLRERRISGRDAALATELVGGTLRLRGAYERAAPNTDSRSWTLELPGWWVDTSTVAARLALTPYQREQWLRHRRRIERNPSR